MDVIFVLEVVFEVPTKQLVQFLRSWGNPEDWIELCEGCTEKIEQLKELYGKLQKVTQEFERGKHEARERMSRTSDPGLRFQGQKLNRRTAGRVGTKLTGQIAISTQCWKLLQERPNQPEALQTELLFKKFLEGDRQAHHLTLKPKPVGTFNRALVFEEEPDLNATEEGDNDETESAPCANDSDEDVNSPDEVLPSKDRKLRSNSVRGNRTKKETSLPLEIPIKREVEVEDNESLTSDDGFAQMEADSVSSDSGPASPTLATEKGNTPSRRSKRRIDIKQEIDSSDNDDDDNNNDEDQNEDSSTVSPPKNKKKRSDMQSRSGEEIKNSSRFTFYCPLFKCKKSKASASVATKHLEECVRKRKNQKSGRTFRKLVCKNCKEWTCPAKDDVDIVESYMEHFLSCLEGVSIDTVKSRGGGDDVVPLRHKIVQCNLCPEERGKYVPYRELSEHVFECHMHPYQCTGPGCFRRFPEVSYSIRSHWKQIHKDLALPAEFKTSYKEVPTTLPEIHWWCPVCFQKFSEEDSRDEHVSSSHHEGHQRSFKCASEACDKEYFCDEELKLHEVLAHKRMRSTRGTFDFECDQCHNFFSTEILLRRHRRVEHGIDLLKCESCPMEYKFRAALKGHVLRRHLGIKQKRKPKMKAEKKERVKKVKEDEGEQKCSVCGRVFASKYKLSYHFAKLHERKLEVTCERCGKVYSDSAQLKRHLFKAHEIGTHGTRYPCPVEGCGVVLFRTLDLEAHVARHNGTRKYECSQCDKAYYRDGDLRKHVRKAHINKKPRVPVTCENCGKQVYGPSHLILHKKKCDKTPTCSHKCVICSRNFQSQAALEEHRQSCKVNDDDEIKQAKHECNICHKSYDRIDLLVRHKKIRHTKDNELKQSKDKELKQSNELKPPKEKELKHSKDKNEIKCALDEDLILD